MHMSLVKHGFQLPILEVKDSKLINPSIHLSNSIKTTTSSQEVSNLIDLEKLCVLGHGNYGTVYKVRHRQTSAIYALKTIRDGGGGNDPDQPSHEVKIMLSTNSPFIIKCLGIHESIAGEKAIVMEYMDAGTLDKLVKDNGPFSEASIAHIAYQVLTGLNYLHSFNIVHLDIKPSNLLVDKDMNVKIGDFGVSKMMQGESQVVDYWDVVVGTYAYMSPERLDSNACDGNWNVYAADVWSLGVSLLELFVGHFPFLPPGQKPNWLQLVLMIPHFGELAPSLPKEASMEFRSFITCCLHKDPSKRWTAFQLLSHPFICREENARLGD